MKDKNNRFNKKYRDRDSFAFEDLEEQRYWDAELEYSIDLTNSDDLTEFHNILKYKLPSNHQLLKIINEVETILDKIISGKQTHPIFKKIRTNTTDHIKDHDSLILYIAESFENKLLHLEIELFLDKISTDKVLPESRIKDKSLNILYPNQVGNIISDYRNNNKFRDCIDDLISLDPEERDSIIDIGTKHFKDWTEDHINLIIEILTRITELSNHSVMRCMDELKLKQKQYCKGLLLADYMEILSIILQYFHINIDLTKIEPTDKPTKHKLNILLNKSIPLIKKIFKKTIELSYFVQKEKRCSPHSVYIPETYDRIYNHLFGTNDSLISYKLFDNYTGWWSKFFGEDMMDKWYKKLILLIILVFMFSKIISLFHFQKEVIKVE